MSLTGHLCDPASPLRPWFANRLPNTTTIAKDADLGLRGAAAQPENTAAIAIAIMQLRPPTRPPLPSRTRGCRLGGRCAGRARPRDTCPSRPDAQHRRHRSGQDHDGDGIPPAIFIEHDAVSASTNLRPWEHELDNEDWRDLSALVRCSAALSRRRVAVSPFQATLEQVADAPPTLTATARHCSMTWTSRMRPRSCR